MILQQSQMFKRDFCDRLVNIHEIRQHKVKKTVLDRYYTSQ